MQGFTEKISFIIFFLVSTLIMNMAFGEKFTQKYLLLVLASMIVVNSKKITSLIGMVKFQ